MSYASPADFTNRYPNRDLVQLTNEDPGATTVNVAALRQALNDAQAEIDGYIQSRYTLPLANPPANLNRLACDIAMYRLQTLRPQRDLEDARQRYEDAVDYLKLVAARKVSLGPQPDSNPAPDNSIAPMGTYNPESDTVDVDRSANNRQIARFSHGVMKYY